MNNKFKYDFEMLKENNINFDNNFNLIENFNYKFSEKILIKLFQLILRKNNYIFSESVIKYYFSDIFRFLIINISENIICNPTDLKLYIISELNLTISNNERLYLIFGNVEIYENINGNIIIKEIE